MASRDLKHLHPKLQPLATAFLDEAKRQGIDVLVTCTYRSAVEQGVLYAKGRTEPGPKVTNAKPGQSKHNFTFGDGTPASKAFDVVPLVNGKPEWKATHPSWAKLGAIGKKLGLEWAGDWTRMREFPHFQLKDWA